MAITVGNFGRQPIILRGQTQNETKEVVETKEEESTTSAASASSNETKQIPYETWKAYGVVNQKITQNLQLDGKESSKPQKTTYVFDHPSKFLKFLKNNREDLKPGDVIIEYAYSSVTTFVINEKGELETKEVKYYKDINS